MAKGKKSADPLTRAQDAGLDSLFTVHPKEFVAARNAIAAALKKDGDPEAAGAVRSLARPAVPVWVVNQVARKAAPDVEALIAVSAALRKAQQATLAGKESDFRTLNERHRALLKSLRAVAADVLGLSPTSTSPNLDRAQATLLAASAGTEAQQARLRAGTLREELAPPGFDVFGFGGAFAAAPPPAASPRPKGEAKPEKRGAAGTKKEEQRHAAEEARERRRREAEEEKARRAREAAAEAAARRDAAEREVAALAEALRKAEAALEEAGQALTEAKVAEAAARKRVAEAKREHGAAVARLKQGG